MNFSKRIQNRARQGDLPALCDWIADTPSWHPATLDGTKYWLPHVHSAKQALAALFAAQYLPYWVTDSIYSRLGELCYLNRYQGTWEVVQRLLENNLGTKIDEKDWLSFQSEDDFFGNFLKDVERLLRGNRHSWKTFEQHGPVRRKVRRRGYQDKGALLPAHKRGLKIPDPNPGEDRRESIHHPLLREAEGVGGDTHPPEVAPERKVN